MKRILPILLLLMLLCSCANTEPGETTGETTLPPANTEPVVAYQPESEMEQLTEGAVRQFELDAKRIDWIAPFTGGVLAASADQQTALWVLSGPEGQVTATANIPVKLTKSAIWQTTDGSFYYYAPAEKQVVQLDAQLQEVKRLQLPETLTGDPAIAPNGSEIFFCTGQTVNAMDTERKIIRPVRTNTCQNQTLLGCYMNGTVLACNVQDAAGQWSTMYISGTDGKLLHKDKTLQRVYSVGDQYFALHKDGTVNQYIYGSADAVPMQMNIAAETAYGALELGGIVGQSKTDSGVRLSYYNMKKSAVVDLPGDRTPIMAAADSDDQGVWLLLEDGVLLYWSLQASAVTDDTDYSGTVYTAQAPDTEGLAQCAQRGDAIGKAFGVVVRVYERALVSNDDYHIEVEYQTHAINRTLDALEAQLGRFPAKFLDKSVPGKIRICIVRSIDGEMKSAYHWHDGDPFIILSAGMDIEKAFLDAFAYVLDIHILGNSSMLDGWESLNPEGFTYGAETTIMAYLEGENRAFADRKGMASITDDRTSVFYHAMMTDNGEVFQSETMQAKLRLLCQAIRDAWHLEQSTETFPWEQYLKQ